MVLETDQTNGQSSQRGSVARRSSPKGKVSGIGRQCRVRQQPASNGLLPKQLLLPTGVFI